MSEPLIAIRDAREGDIPFVFDSWIKSYWKSGPSCSLVPYHLFHKGQHEVIEDLQPGSNTDVAVSLEDDSQIIGWVCRARGSRAVHYCYVKEPFRRFGIAKQLLRMAQEADSVLTYTHRTDICARLPIPAGWTYDPFQTRRD